MRGVKAAASADSRASLGARNIASQSSLRDDATGKNKSRPGDHGDKEENATR
jgi:hypothetical protein